MSENTPNGSQEIHVATAAELMAALSTAQGGEHIVLASGDYGALSLYAPRETFIKYEETVTIRSADPGDRAVFSKLGLFGAENIAFEDVHFKYDFEEGDVQYTESFVIRESQNISFTNSKFEGDVAEGRGEEYDGYGTGIGLRITQVDGLTIENSEISDFYRGALVDNTSNMSLINNEWHSMSSDGIDIASTTDLLIEGNYFHDFDKSPNNVSHMDMIQFWTAGVDTPTTDVVIRGNILHSGDGDWTQSIFMRNEAVDQGVHGEEMYYRNVLIEDNVIYNAHLHGITVGETDGLVIRNNTLIHNAETWDAGAVSTPVITVNADARNVLVENNLTPLEISASNDDHVFLSNVVAQNADAEADNHYGKVFVNGLAGASATLDDLKIVPNAAFDGVGAALSAFDLSPDAVQGFIEYDSGETLNSLQTTFDMSNLFGPDGAIDLTNAVVTWDFDDGETGTGVTANHVYAQSGLYAVTATVTLDGGETFTLVKNIGVESPIVLQVLGDAPLTDSSDFGRSVTVGDTVEIVDGAIQLNEGVVQIAASANMVNNTQYTFGFDFKAESIEGGRIIDFAGSFVVMETPTGLQLGVTTNVGTSWLKIQDAGLADNAWHSLTLVFDGEAGAAVVYIDGVESARVDGLEGQIQAGTNANLVIGDLYNNDQFDGLIDNVVMVTGAVDVSSGESLKDFRAAAIAVEPDVEVAAPEPAPEAETPVGLAVVAGDDDDVVDGDAGADRLSGGAGDDMVYGGAGDDILEGGFGDDVLEGGEGSDWAEYINAKGAISANLTSQTAIDGSGGRDALIAIENLSGSSYGDRLTGTTGDNRLFGNGGFDRLSGGSGDDWLSGGGGADVIIGGSGADWADYSDDVSGMIANLTSETALDGFGYRDTVRGIENVEGSDFDDRITGTRMTNELRGGDGADWLSGGDGHDWLVGGSGADVMIGGSGVDTADYSEAGQAVDVHIGAGVATDGTGDIDTLRGFENVIGSDFDDVLTGTNQNNVLVGGAGDDILNGGVGNDALEGGAGEDQLIGGGGIADLASYANDLQGVAVDLVAQQGTDGGGDVDTFTDIDGAIGSAFDDTLIGNDFNNRLFGGDGDDLLIGGGRGDVLTGGSGADTFRMTSNFDYEKIMDFEVGVDSLDFSQSASVNSLADVEIASIFGGASTRITSNADQSDFIVLVGVTVAELETNDFIF